jgi:hypothetical protein
MKKQSLTEAARATHRNPRRVYSDEEVELALAWLRGEVTGFQLLTAAFTKETDGSRIYSYVAPRLRHAYRTGKLTIVEEK